MNDKDTVGDIGKEAPETPEREAGEQKPASEAELSELNDRYLRLYAEFENYKKRVQKEKEDLVKYGNEDLLYHMLPVIDNLEMALQHATSGPSEGLVTGVEMTLREFQRVAEKFGLTQIPAAGRPFDPAVHHAMAQVERSDLNDKTVVEEYRKGYMYSGKVLRPSLVAVSKKPAQPDDVATTIEINKGLKEE